jgi:hypothetical protein
MPTYSVKPEKSGPSVIGAIGKDKVRYPSVRVEVNPEIIRSLEIGQSATVTLEGKIVSLSENRYSDKDRCDLEIELREVEAYPSDKGTKKSDPKYSKE